ncbi:MAG: hypothetical protein QOD69_2735 [Solirubrobacteraceae bacterium]|jgi:hypothetical protein|nr:hypothetical protein [Solirubrobacteraceae bacterium]
MSATLRHEPDAAAPPGPADAGAFPAGRRSDLLWQLALFLLLAGTAAFMFYLARGLTFNLDEWIVVTERRGPGAPSLLEPHNEHLSVLLLSVFLGLLRIGGLDDQPLMMVPLVALQVALGALLFVVARRRLGAGVAVGVAALAMVSGLAYENFLIPGQAGQMASIVAGVAAFAVLDRPPDQRRDRTLAVLLAVALASSGMGIPVLIGIAVELLLTPEGRRRLWIVGVPFGLYLVWYVFYGVTRAGTDEITLSVIWAWTAASHAAGALIGQRQVEPGQDLLVVLLVVLAYRAFRVGRASRIRMAALATVLVTFYGLTGISRHDIAPPSSSRYLTVGLVFLLLLLVEAARGLRVRRWVPWVVLLFAFIALSKDHKVAFREGRGIFLERSEEMRGSLAAVELLGRRRVAPDFEIAPRAAPFLLAGPWFGAIDGLEGDPAYTPAQLATAPAPARNFADDTLVRAGGLAEGPATAATAGCVRPWRGDEGPVPAAGLRVEAGRARVTLRARRFGDQWVKVGLLSLPPGQAVELQPLPDAAPAPYVLQLPGPARACRLDG